MLRVQERPVPMDTWTAMLTRSGFTEVTASTIVAEAGLVTGRRPDSPAGRNAPARITLIFWWRMLPGRGQLAVPGSEAA